MGFLLDPGQFLVWSLDFYGVGAGVAVEESEPSTCKEGPLALEQHAMERTLSVVQDLKLFSFLAGRFRGHLTVLSHFTVEKNEAQ